MTREVLSEPMRSPRYVRAPVPLHFPSEADVPETALHLHLRTALFLILWRRLGDRACIGSEQFVYWDPTDPTACLAPDAFVRLAGPQTPLASYKVWEHGAPHVAVEIVSASDSRDQDWAEKLHRYRRAGVAEVVRFDPDARAGELRIWDLVEGDLVERDPGDSEWRRSAALDAYWYTQENAKLGPMLRLADRSDGTGVWDTPTEAEERERAAKEAALRRVAELEEALRKRP